MLVSSAANITFSALATMNSDLNITAGATVTFLPTSSGTSSWTYINGAGASVSLGANRSFNGLELRNGTLSTNGTTCTWGSFYSYPSCNQSAVRVLNLGASGIGFNLALNLTTSKLDFDVIVGTDRTAGQSTNPRCIISTDYDSLQSGTLKDSEIVYKNIVYGAGQGVGDDRNIRKKYTGMIS